MKPDKRVVKLKELCKKQDVVDFGSLFFPLYLNSPTKWLTIAREQRLFENFRNSELMESLKMNAFVASRGCDPQVFLSLSQHIDVCLVGQAAYDFIDSETRAVTAHPISRSFYNSTIIRISEVVAEATNRRFKQELEGGYQPTQIHQFAAPGQLVRDMADACNVLLSSVHPFRSWEATEELTDDPQIDTLIALAMKYLETKTVLDMYTYGRYKVEECGTHFVKFVDRDHLRSVISGVASERNASQDNTRNQVILMAERHVDECICAPEEASSFEEFLANNQNCIPLLRRFADTVVADLVHEIELFFDTDNVLDEGTGITVADLTKCWGVLRALALMVGQWQQKRPWEDVRVLSVADLPRVALVSMVQEYLACSRLKARALIRRFQVRGDRKPVDLFFTPLLMSKRGDRLTVCSKFIETGRFERNVFSMLVADGVLDQDGKGFRPLEDLAEAFREAGFFVANDVAIKQNKVLLTDADLLAFKDGHFFVAQAKVVIEPDTVYESWKAEERLRHASKQLSICETHLQEAKNAFKAVHPSADIDGSQVTYFILTNSRQFTELWIGDYPVVDLPYLKFLLEGATGTILISKDDTLGIGSGKSFISGEYPTGNELCTLMIDTIHGVKRRYKGKTTQELEVGVVRIVSPMTMLHPSTNPFMKVLSDVEMAEFMTDGSL